MRLTAVAAFLGLSVVTAACAAERGGNETAEQRGRELVVTYGCTSCHQVPGVDAPQGQVGPPLGSFGERRAVAGRLPNNADNAARWIREPQDVDPRTIMPDLGVTEQESRDIVAYLYSLRDRAGQGDAEQQP